MQSMTTAADDLINSGSYTQAVRVSITWPGSVSIEDDITPHVGSWDVDRALTTDTPDGTRLITGYPAASANLTLVGDTAVQWFNPYDTDSPMWRKSLLGLPITVENGVVLDDGGSEYVTVFSGYVVDYTVDPKGGTVQVLCGDGRSLLKTAPTLPPAYSDPVVIVGENAPILLTAGYALNGLMESIGLYTAPPERPDCIYRATNNGSPYPQKVPAGSPDTVSGDSFSVWDGLADTAVGKFAPLVATSATVSYDSTETIDFGSSAAPLFVEFWVKNVGDALAYGGGFDIGGTGPSGTTDMIKQVSLSAYQGTPGGAMTLSVFITAWLGGSSVVESAESTLTVAADSEWHYVAIQASWTDASTVSAMFWVDDDADTPQDIDMGADVPAESKITFSAACLLFPWEGLQVTRETDPTVAGLNNDWSASSSVSFDKSLNNLTVLPDVGGKDAWALCQAIAAAEDAVFGMDETGVFRFYNRDTLAARTSVRTVTSTASLKDLQQQISAAGLANRVRIPVNGRQLSDPTRVWVSPDVIQIPANGSWSTVASTEQPVVAVASTDSGVAPSGGGTAGKTYWRAARKSDGSGGEVSAGITVTAEQLSSQAIAVTVKNTNPFSVWMVSPTGTAYPDDSDGKPCIVIGGRFAGTTATAPDTSDTVTGASYAEAKWQPSITADGERYLELQANEWVQNQGEAQTRADTLLADLYKPRPLIRGVQIVPDPRLQITDRITITDPDVSLLDGEDVLIVGVRTTGDQGTYSQDLTVKAWHRPGAWLLGVTGRSELGTTTWI